MVSALSDYSSEKLTCDKQSSNAQSAPAAEPEAKKPRVSEMLDQVGMAVLANLHQIQKDTKEVRS